jgi:hypothetical protein
LKYCFFLSMNCYPEPFQSFIMPPTAPIAPIAPIQTPLSTLLCFPTLPPIAGLFSNTEFRVDSGGPPFCPWYFHCHRLGSILISDVFDSRARSRSSLSETQTAHIMRSSRTVWRGCTRPSLQGCIFLFALGFLVCSLIVVLVSFINGAVGSESCDKCVTVDCVAVARPNANPLIAFSDSVAGSDSCIVCVTGGSDVMARSNATSLIALSGSAVGTVGVEMSCVWRFPRSIAFAQ